jgi:DNA-binding NarL/FixJ family response regulator
VQAFVGRTNELETLAEVTDAADSGPAMAIVVGQPGSGKSRVLAEARARSALQHTFAVVGYETERQVPLAAAAGLLRELTNEPKHGGHLEGLLFGPQDGTGLEPVRVFEAAHRAFRAFEPSLLVVDDLQWVDGLSVALCHYLIRAAAASDQRLVVFAATRSGGAGAPFADALPAEQITSIELAPLSREEGIELVLGLGTGLDRGLASELWEQANGSPFWLEALGRVGGVATGLTQVLTLQLRGTGPDAATLLSLLAVGARPLSVADTCALVEWPLPRLENALHELVDHGIVHEAVGTMRLSHDLVREAAVAELSDDVRRRIHRRLAEHLELEPSSDLRLVRQALEHRRAAGMPTLAVALRLARSPHRKLLGTEGLKLLADIVDETDPFNEDALALQEEVASLATDLAEHEQALARWSLVADRAGESLPRALALLAASKAAYELDRLADARALLRRSREIGVADDALKLEQRTHEAAILLWLEQRTAEGRVLTRDAVAAAAALATRAGGVRLLDAHERRAYLHTLQLEYEAAVQESDTDTMLRSADAREQAARGFDLESYLDASLARCTALRWAGRAREAMERARSVWTEARRHVFPRVAVAAGEGLAGSLQTLGDLAEAERVVRETVELAARAGDVPRARHRVARVACNVALERGEPWAALERLERETTQETNDHQRIAFHGDLAIWNARLKGAAATETVREQVAAGRANAEKVGCPRCEAELLLLSAEALALIGDYDQAQALLATRDSRDALEHQLASLIRSHAGALAEGDAEARAAKLDVALVTAEEMPYKLEALWIRFDLGLALAEAGSDRAAPELERAAAVASELGAGTVEALAGRALRSLGVRTWRRKATEGAVTEREREIARLVAAGASNPEIARQLFLSRKTVERHVSNLLRKVGARNRAELAARVAELEVEGAPR